MITRRYDEMEVRIYDSNAELSKAASGDLARILRAAIAERGTAAIIVATGNSQLSFMEAMRGEPGIAWDRVTIFHMDEYLGMPEEHPASFRRFIREKLAGPVGARQFYGIRGDAADIQAELQRYTRLLEEHRPVACVLGIGENGHLAFNNSQCRAAACAPARNLQACHAERVCHQGALGVSGCKKEIPWTLRPGRLRFRAVRWSARGQAAAS